MSEEALDEATGVASVGFRNDVSETAGSFVITDTART